MKIVRAFWGTSEYVKSEIPKSPLFGNEIVFVWGYQNNEYIKSLGYHTVFVKDKKFEKSIKDPKLSSADIYGMIEDHKNNYHTDSRYSHHLKHFAHKLETLKFADKMFDEYLFLDWDITIAKPLDDKFYKKIRSKGNFQCPIYCYHDNWIKDVINTIPDLTSDAMQFLLFQSEQLNKYHWKQKGRRILPCAGFIYSNKANKGQELLDIFNKYNLTCCIEEFAIYIMANCSLEEYIQKYEPIVLRGKEFDKNLDEMTEEIKNLNSYISTKIEKDIYLYHDI